MNKLKYKTEKYLNCGFYTSSEGEEYYSNKIVKVRKSHYCSFCNPQEKNCSPNIKKGDYAYFEKCLLGIEWVTSYTCMYCLDKWIDEHE